MSARTHVTITPDVQDVLNRSSLIEPARGEPWRLVLPERLDRSLYVSTNKVLTLLGGKWHKRRGAHIFKDDPRHSLGRVLNDGEVPDIKKITQAYYTPAPLAKQMAQMVRIYVETNLLTGQRGPLHVLEPSAGHGAIAEAVRHELAMWSVRLHCIDIDPNSCNILREKGFKSVHEGDFLQVVEQPQFLGIRYSAIVMNPPFTKGQDIDHVCMAYNKLAPVGCLVALMSPSVETGSTRRHDRFKAMLKSAEKFTSQLIPEGTFAESGTPIATRLYAIIKPKVL